MTGYERLEWILKHITYKPLVSIELRKGHDIFDPDGHSIYIVVKQKNFDANKGEGSDPIEIISQYRVPMTWQKRDVPERQILEVIECAVRQSEIHEMHEWLRFNGVPITDPHPELKDGQRDKR